MKPSALQCAVQPMVIALTTLLLAGCQSSKEAGQAPAAAPVVATAKPTTGPVAAPPSGPAKTAPGVIRIRVGDPGSLTDSTGNLWLGDRGFADGDTIARPDLKIENTKDPELYRCERYGMSAFSYPLPNGRYVVKLHFAETFEGITGPGERVFSFQVQGQEFKDFDVWVKAGGPQRAYVETVNVEVTSGKLEIKFTPKVENPQINGIEIFPL